MDDEWRIADEGDYEPPVLLDFVDISNDDEASELAGALHDYLINRRSQPGSSWDALRKTVFDTAEVVRRIDTTPSRTTSTVSPTMPTPSRKRTPAEKTAQAVSTRLPSILAALDSQPHPVSVDELCAYLLRGAPSRGQHAVHEDAALLRAHKGYSCRAGDLTQWQTALRPQGIAPTLAQFCEDSLDLLHHSIEDRLSQRLANLTADPTLSRWLQTVLVKIECLYFQRDYSNHTHGHGSKRWLSGWREKEFTEWLKHQPRWPDILAIPEDDRPSSELYKSHRKTFDRELESLKRSRSRLADLYEKFGPAIVLDPFFTLDDCYAFRSDYFQPVYAELHAPDTARARLVANVQATTETLCALASFVGGPSVAHYLDVFLARFVFAV
ncbi:uncharacterized protein STEHIDRAFT_153614 [Stereum hirsutum FP-91666 SS1]|uniref:uncharacterized protein n=1 Tax=Stereum hirsutum (strain FP-91666) TaxID=721885 RepID=UPI000440B90E|nr:uncharacterized protein STEHIDRAFT_153614 [Stereum hirsutum FP-91666 SS1]EIM89773.1 hypothetical protein STEHIDRAFT_153614 [Stereum hirsutum FP-91666 SS1]